MAAVSAAAAATAAAQKKLANGTTGKYFWLCTIVLYVYGSDKIRKNS